MTAALPIPAFMDCRAGTEQHAADRAHGCGVDVVAPGIGIVEALVRAVALEDGLRALGACLAQRALGARNRGPLPVIGKRRLQPFPGGGSGRALDAAEQHAKVE